LPSKKWLEAEKLVKTMISTVDPHTPVEPLTNPFDFISGSSVSKGSEQFRYKNEDLLPTPSQTSTTLNLINVYKFWNEKKTKYPQLYELSQMYLIVPSTSSEQERRFSTVTNILSNNKRNRLSDEKVEIFCYMNNI